MGFNLLTIFLLIARLFDNVICTQYIIQLVENTQVNAFLKKHDIDVMDSNILPIEIGNSFIAFSGDLSKEQVSSVFEDNAAAAISTEKYLELQGYLKQTDAPKHLGRLTKDSIKSSQYHYANNQYIFSDTSGNGVDIYIVDTGIDIQHPIYLQNNIHKLIDLTTSPIPSGDFNGHGTAMAGIINSDPFGVLKSANLVDVRVVDANTKHATMSRVLSALSLIEKHEQKTMRPSIIVLPFQTEKNTILESAIENISKKIPVIIPAGNKHQNACKLSPMGIKKLSNVLVVGSLEYSEEQNYLDIAKFSNYGSCVDIYTSGVDISTLKTSSNGGKELIHNVTGTSYSCGIVAGVVGYYMSKGMNGTDAVSKVLSSPLVATRSNTSIKELKLFI
ncbi:hypothetical protein TPHA_0B04520 [Tetrapisispora phaffii CBS 4417]|uniref:Peptidase S8/S53 domain-containing protein n=1 Tax=Tetrapisispora phaffii (strain ATCC 24235 / CBS 4417 / NBRC 1672 / NRRL Y-8282 / UCD 70-5) TaxID=1071381 RepID=G8BQ40_TETPH|nr:hypothetical protein TPHA_0B04520 [Tetrapisispora phaffii CBS 4417]CCE62121.1 hypothetical protein TPHA_0B04520 [Tetrapisispora phaffii CBS 4417]